MYQIIAAQRTDQGRVRQNNEDSLAAAEREGVYLFAIADGLGGLEHGEVASQEAASEALRIFKQTARVSDKYWLRRAFQKINFEIFNINKPLDPSEWMATTLTVSQFCEGRLCIGHVGDCRVYQIRDGQISCLTSDHTIDRHTLTRAIGTKPDVEVDVYETELKAHDVYIQCSDGLYSMVGDEEVIGVVKNFPLEKSAERLIFLANQNGGLDNISLQVIHVI